MLNPSVSVDVSAWLRAAGVAVEGCLDRVLRERSVGDGAWPMNLVEAVRYAAMGQGKRVRPALVLMAEAAVRGGPGEPKEQAPWASGVGAGVGVGVGLMAATAIELVHTFSLVHDDLPAMDDDDLRRGRPTLHRVVGGGGEAMAILAGDVMLSLAFELLAGAGADAGLSGGLLKELSGATNAMIAGQVWDTLPPWGPDGLTAVASGGAVERLRLIHSHKTGALIRCGCVMGGLCGGASARQLEALRAYGEAVGLMFQVVDDLLDVTRTAAEVGKATGKDAAAGKLTYPGVLGVDGTRAEAARLLDDALAAVSPLGDRAEPLRALAGFVAERER